MSPEESCLRLMDWPWQFWAKDSVESKPKRDNWRGQVQAMQSGMQGAMGAIHQNLGQLAAATGKELAQIQGGIQAQGQQVQQEWTVLNGKVEYCLQRIGEWEGWELPIGQDDLNEVAETVADMRATTISVIGTLREKEETHYVEIQHRLGALEQKLQTPQGIPECSGLLQGVL